MDLKSVKRNLLLAVFLTTTAAMAAEPEPLFAGGMDLGGGHGIACFANAEQAQAVKDQQGKIDSHSLEQITSLEPLDLAEAKASSDTLVEPYSGEEYDQFVERIIFYTESSSPAIGAKLRKAQEALWATYYSTPHPIVAFFGKRISLSANCTYVQLAFQYMREAHVHLDSRLFFHPRMTVQGQATLVLHELVLSLFGSDESSGTKTSAAVSVLLTAHLSPSEVTRRLTQLGLLQETEPQD